ncbi:MAG: hypothetical protein ACM3H8_03005 [Sphingobacteriales bacterium]
MRWISFLAKLAFICNVCFLLCFLIRYSNLELNEEIIAIIIILGWVMAIAINIFSMTANIVGKVKGSYARAEVPAWLFLSNFVMMGVEIFYLVLNPDLL